MTPTEQISMVHRMRAIALASHELSSDLVGMATGAAMVKLLDNWTDATADAAEPGATFSMNSACKDIDALIDNLKHVRTAVEAGMSDAAGVSTMRQRLGLPFDKVEGSGVAASGESGNLVIGTFYEIADGRIVRTYGCDGRAGTIKFYFDDDTGSHAVTFAEAHSWKRRQDLADFPNARDPRLPYEFDLHWDIKHVSELKALLKEGHEDIDEIRAQMKTHKIFIDELPEAESWFDVLAYTTKEIFEGPDLADDGLEGFSTLEGALQFVDSLPADKFYEVQVVAYGEHPQYEPGAIVYSKNNVLPVAP